MGARNCLRMVGLSVLAAMVLWAGLSSELVNARQVRLFPEAKDVRFELLGNEPIAAPDNIAVVKDWSVLVFKDRKSGRCYVAFKHDRAIAVETLEACAE